MSFEKLYNQYRGLISSFCQRILGNSADVEDVVQEVFIKVYRATANASNDVSNASWLFRVATNTSLNFLRTNRRKSRMVIRLRECSTGFTESMEQSVEARQRLRRVERALDEKERRMICDYYLNNLSQSQLAAVYGISQTALSKRLLKIRNKLG